jgi:hypothetical protein
MIVEISINLLLLVLLLTRGWIYYKFKYSNVHFISYLTKLAYFLEIEAIISTFVILPYQRKTILNWLTILIWLILLYYLLNLFR